MPLISNTAWYACGGSDDPTTTKDAALPSGDAVSAVSFSLSSAGTSSPDVDSWQCLQFFACSSLVVSSSGPSLPLLHIFARLLSHGTGKLSSDGPAASVTC